MPNVGTFVEHSKIGAGKPIMVYVEDDTHCHQQFLDRFEQATVVKSIPIKGMRKECGKYFPKKRKSNPVSFHHAHLEGMVVNVIETRETETRELEEVKAKRFRRIRKVPRLAVINFRRDMLKNVTISATFYCPTLDKSRFVADAAEAVKLAYSGNCHFCGTNSKECGFVIMPA